MVFRDAAEGPIVCGLTQLHASNSVAGSLGENVVLTLVITWPRRALYRKDEKGGGSGAWHCYTAASRGLSKIFVI
jgi:hypothetical protein